MGSTASVRENQSEWLIGRGGGDERRGEEGKIDGEGSQSSVTGASDRDAGDYAVNATKGRDF